MTQQKKLEAFLFEAADILPYPPFIQQLEETTGIAAGIDSASRPLANLHCARGADTEGASA